jgi:hypothetical protein
VIKLHGTGKNLTKEDGANKEGAEEKPFSLKDHIPFLIASISAIFISIRILSIAHYNVETGFAILQYGGTAQVLLGAVISTIGQASPVLATVCFGAIRMSGARLGALERSVITVLGVFFCVASFFLTTIPTLVFIVVVNVLIEIVGQRKGEKFDREIKEVIDRSDLTEIQLTMRKLERKRRRLQASMKRFSLVIVVYSGILFGIIAVNTSPWMPTERLLFTNGRHTETVYILSSSDSEYVFLDAATRKIEFASSGIVKNQAICATKSNFLNETIPALLSAGPDYASC